MTTSARSRWIIELDYEADPDLAAEDVRRNIQDEVSAFKNDVQVQDDVIICDALDEAFTLRMRFSENIVDIRSTAAHA